MKLIVVSSLWLLMLSCLCEAKVVWDKEINEFKTSLSIGNNNNLYNQVDEPVSASFLAFKAQANYLKLFEGYGFNLPLSVNRKVYRNISDLSNLDFSLNPSIKFFLSDKVDANVNLTKAQSHVLPGADGVEFITTEYKHIKVTNDIIGVEANLGSAPEQTFLNLAISKSETKQKYDELILSDNESKNLNVLVGYLISEDTYLLFNSAYKDEITRLGETNIKEMGTGIKSALGGSHILKAIIGFYQRKGANNFKGSYWEVTDLWHISEKQQIEFSTLQSSIVSNSGLSQTQLNTTTTLGYRYHFNTDHIINFRAYNLKRVLEENKDKFFEAGVNVSWYWSIIDDVSTTSNISFSKVDNTQKIGKYSKVNLDLSLEYVF